MSNNVNKNACATREKFLSCLFSSHVPCSFRKSEKSGIMPRCSGCGHYKRFVNEVEREEEEFWKEVDEENRGGSVER